MWTPTKKKKKKYRSGKQSNKCQGSGGVDYRKTTLGNSGGSRTILHHDSDGCLTICVCQSDSTVPHKLYILWYKRKMEIVMRGFLKGENLMFFVNIRYYYMGHMSF